jgi:hypothetical protein
MKLKFGWREISDNPRPTSKSDRVNKDGVSLLSNLLMDHGGGDYIHSLPWIEKGLRLVETVKRGEAESLEWVRDAWAVLLRQDGATIYSLYDENYTEVIDLDVFESALRAWMEFIRLPPDSEATMTIDI